MDSDSRPLRITLTQLCKFSYPISTLTVRDQALHVQDESLREKSVIVTLKGLDCRDQEMKLLPRVFPRYLAPQVFRTSRSLMNSFFTMLLEPANDLVQVVVPRRSWWKG